MRTTIVFLITVILGSMSGSFIAFILGRMPIYIYVIFPAITGFAVAYCIVYSLRFYKISNKRIILWSSMLSAIFSYIGFHLWDYIFFLLIHIGHNTATNTYLLKRTGYSGFWGFLIFKAQQPLNSFVIPNYSDSQQSIPFLRWFLWSLDFLVVLICSVFIASNISENKQS